MKKIMCLVMAVCIMATMTACNSSVSFVFDVETGDQIKIGLDTTDGYSLSPDVPFVISCDGKELSQGTFAVGDSYDLYKNAVADEENAKEIETGEKDGCSYIMWSYDNTEFNYVIRVTENTTIVLGNNVSEDSARACFDRLTITVVE